MGTLYEIEVMAGEAGTRTPIFGATTQYFSIELLAQIFYGFMAYKSIEPNLFIPYRTLTFPQRHG